MRYLTKKEIIAINVLVIKKYSPQEPLGVKEPTALDMLVHAPQQEVFGEELYPTCEKKAANIFRNLIKKHVFYNGNKRTAVLALTTFLEVNNYPFKADKEEILKYIEKIIEEDIEEKQISEWIKAHQ